MKKREFLETLREQLQGEVSQARMEEHIRYYDEYISGEIRKGRTESEVLETLGSPVFIAKTLIDINETIVYGEQDAREQEYRETSGYTDGSGEYGDRAEDFMRGIHTYSFPPKTLKGWLSLAGIVLCLMAVLSLLGTLTLGLLRFFAPFLLIMFLISMFTGRR